MEDPEIIRMIENELARRQKQEIDFLHALHQAGVTSGKLHVIARLSIKVQEPTINHLANALRDIERGISHASESSPSGPR